MRKENQIRKGKKRTEINTSGRDSHKKMEGKEKKKRLLYRGRILYTKCMASLLSDTDSWMSQKREEKGKKLKNKRWNVAFNAFNPGKKR